MIPSAADLTYFLEVANLLNLSRASEILGISQPSLSLAMQRLEQSVGTPILIRHKRGVSLTKAGKQLLTHTRLLMQHWETIKSATLASEHEVQGSFTIGCHPSVALYSLPKFLPDLMEKYPKLEIKLQHDSSRKVTEQVISLAVDIGIAINPTKHVDLVIKKIGDDVITLWKSNSANATQNIHSEQAIIICDPNLLQTQAILKKLKKQGLPFARMLTTSNLEVIAELTAAGGGIGILPTNLAKCKNLIPVANTPQFADELCVVYHGENRDVKAIQVIATAIKAAIQTM